MSKKKEKIVKFKYFINPIDYQIIIETSGICVP